MNRLSLCLAWAIGAGSLLPGAAGCAGSGSAPSPSGTAAGAGQPDVSLDAEAGSREAYVASIEVWRREREERLRSDTGWLTIAGFHWLEPGENRFGSDPGNAVILPGDASPPRAGAFLVSGSGDDTRVAVRVDEGVEVLLDHVAVSERPLSTDGDGDPDVLTLGRLRMWVIERGAQLAIRVRDPQSPLRRDFTGLDAYAIQPGYRVEGRLRRSDPPIRIPLPNVLGFVDTVMSPGRVVFDLDGTSCSLLPVVDDPADSVLFFVFSDRTSGIETYGAGRFLYAGLEPDGRVILDFNKAYNPPCALNPYTTCPLPPEGNRLPVAVRAGEKAYKPPAVPGR